MTTITLSCTSPTCDATYVEQYPTKGAKYYCHRHTIFQPMIEIEVFTDDSIDRAFKKLRSALRERARIYNKFINRGHRRKYLYLPGIYKTRVIQVWNQALGIADLDVRNAVKELERLT